MFWRTQTNPNPLKIKGEKLKCGLQLTIFGWVCAWGKKTRVMGSFHMHIWLKIIIIIIIIIKIGFLWKNLFYFLGKMFGVHHIRKEWHIWWM